MSHLKYYTYPGFGEHARETFSYSQAVRIGDRIELSGQGGWDPNDINVVISKDLMEEIDQAFYNVDHALKHAGGQGISQVFRINSYHVVVSDEVLGRMVENFRKWIPTHQVIWTMHGVTKLGLDGMNVEIEAVAHDPQPAV